MSIRELFDPNKGIDRPIEKVITYAADSEEFLKSEISEYIITDHIEEQFRELMYKMQSAMDSGNAFEVGVWVSGFYGSGKSSFTKYFGMAMDDSITIDGIPFRKHLQDRFRDDKVKAFLNTLPKKFPAAVVLHDLASEQISDDPTADVTTILFHKVLQLAGYSRNMKVAAFERKLKKDGRYDEFLTFFKDEVEEDWATYQDDPLIVDGILPEMAHKMYPKLFPDTTSFKSDDSDIIVMTNERVQEMLDIVYEWKGTRNVIFVVDEIGQYVGSQQQLITNLDGLAKNLKDIGKGKVWIIGTAQQTLTEDNPKAAINSPELYKLKDRFPIRIDLESSDIREISYRRLLEKSVDGEKRLKELFDKNGQSLRSKTRLENAQFYDSQFDQNTFVKLYPFLPAHFDILLHLLAQLAKSTGGMGLRSAIKVIQEILKGDANSVQAVADKEVGWLATSVTLFDSLRKDIKEAFPAMHNSVSNVEVVFAGKNTHIAVAKTVAILQILKNIPVSAKNVSSLLQSSVDGSSKLEEVNTAIKEMTADSRVPFGEQDGSLRFFSEKLNSIDKYRADIIPRTVEQSRVFNENVREVFKRLPSVRIHGSLNVQSGIQLYSTSQNHQALDGDRNTVQTVFHFVDSDLYDDELNKLITESRQQVTQNNIFLIARKDDRISELQREIVKCREIYEKYRNDPDSEIKEYVKSQNQLEDKYKLELQSILKQKLIGGSLIFRGEQVSVDALGSSVLESVNTYLNDVALTVYDRYNEAPVRVRTNIAEQFLRTDNIGSITEEKDPLNLVKIAGGDPKIDTDQKAIISIKDYLDKRGSADGKYLLKNFSEAPFGWAQDTLRYLIAAMLVAGEIKLRIGGHDITTKGQKAIDALKNNNAFKPIGVSLRDDRPSIDVLATASNRLTELLGETVHPLEQQIIKKVMSEFHRFKELGSLKYRLNALQLPGSDRVDDLIKELNEILSTDGSDVPQRLGKTDSFLYEQLTWANAVERALDGGLEVTIKELKENLKALKQLPNDVFERINQKLEEEIDEVEKRLNSDEFFEHIESYQSLLTKLRVEIEKLVEAEKEEQKTLIQEVKKDLTRHEDWSEINNDEQQQVVSSVTKHISDVEKDLTGLEKIIKQSSELHRKVAEQKGYIKRIGDERRMKRLKEERETRGGKPGDRIVRKVSVPGKISERDKIDDLIQQLQKLRSEMDLNKEIDVEFSFKEE